MMRTYQYKLHPSNTEAKRIDRWLGNCQALYNACLEQREIASRWIGEGYVPLKPHADLLDGYAPGVGHRVDSNHLGDLDKQRIRIHRIDRKDDSGGLKKRRAIKDEVTGETTGKESPHGKMCPSISFYDMTHEVKHVREIERFGLMHTAVLHGVVKRVSKSFDAFYGGRGYPKYRRRRDYNSLTYLNTALNYNIRKNGRMSKMNLPKLAKSIPFRHDRPIEGQVRTVTVKRDIDQYWVQFACDDVAVGETPIEGRGEVGIDVGVRHFATLSTGEHIPYPAFLDDIAGRVKRAQKILSRRAKGSNRWRKQVVVVKRAHRDLQDARLNHHRQMAAMLVKRYSYMAVEDIRIGTIVERRPGDGMREFRRRVLNCAWGLFVDCLKQAAEKYGSTVVEVDPAYTSQMCSGCGRVAWKSRAETSHSCSCGLVLDRDHNAAINILERARGRPSWRDDNGQPNEARTPASIPNGLPKARREDEPEVTSVA